MFGGVRLIATSWSRGCAVGLDRGTEDDARLMSVQGIIAAKRQCKPLCLWHIDHLLNLLVVILQRFVSGTLHI